jgi:hypothetical protein
MGSGCTAPPFLTSALDGSEWSPSRPGRFTPGKRAPSTNWLGRWVDPRAGLDAIEKNKILPCRESNPGRPAQVHRYTDWVIPAPIKSFVLIIKIQVLFLELQYSLQSTVYIWSRSAFVRLVCVASNDIQRIHSTSGGTEESHAKSVTQPTVVSLPSCPNWDLTFSAHIHGSGNLKSHTVALYRVATFRKFLPHYTASHLRRLIFIFTAG